MPDDILGEVLILQSAEFASAAEEAGISVRPFAGDGVRVSIGENAANDVLLSVAAATLRARVSSASQIQRSSAPGISAACSSTSCSRLVLALTWPPLRPCIRRVSSPLTNGLPWRDDK